jgi:hypothetical protein
MRYLYAGTGRHDDDVRCSMRLLVSDGLASLDHMEIPAFRRGPCRISIPEGGAVGLMA